MVELGSTANSAVVVALCTHITNMCNAVISIGGEGASNMTAAGQAGWLQFAAAAMNHHMQDAGVVLSVCGVLAAMCRDDGDGSTQR